MPEGDPLESVDRGLAILNKLAVLPILLDLLLQLAWSTLGGCCWGCGLVLLVLLLFGSLYPLPTTVILLLVGVFIIWAYRREAMERQQRH